MKERIDELGGLIEEFKLEGVRLQGEDWSVEFQRHAPTVGQAAPAAAPRSEQSKPRASGKKKTASAPSGVPVNSPTTGIYYSSPNPGAPPFVKVGDTVEAGQVIGLIEAMKVFNEITATVSGSVLRVSAQNGQLVQPGDPLIYIG